MFFIFQVRMRSSIMSIISHWSDKLNWNKTWTSAILSRVK